MKPIVLFLVVLGGILPGFAQQPVGLAGSLWSCGGGQPNPALLPASRQWVSTSAGSIALQVDNTLFRTNFSTPFQSVSSVLGTGLKLPFVAVQGKEYAIGDTAAWNIFAGSTTTGPSYTTRLGRNVKRLKVNSQYASSIYLPQIAISLQPYSYRTAYFGYDLNPDLAQIFQAGLQRGEFYKVKYHDAFAAAGVRTWGESSASVGLLQHIGMQSRAKEKGIWDHALSVGVTGKLLYSGRYMDAQFTNTFVQVVSPGVVNLSSQVNYLYNSRFNSKTAIRDYQEPDFAPINRSWGVSLGVAYTISDIIYIDSLGNKNFNPYDDRGRDHRYMAYRSRYRFSAVLQDVGHVNYSDIQGGEYFSIANGIKKEQLKKLYTTEKVDSFLVHHNQDAFARTYPADSLVIYRLPTNISWLTDVRIRNKFYLSIAGQNYLTPEMRRMHIDNYHIIPRYETSYLTVAMPMGISMITGSQMGVSIRKSFVRENNHLPVSVKKKGKSLQDYLGDQMPTIFLGSDNILSSLWQAGNGQGIAGVQVYAGLSWMAAEAKDQTLSQTAAEALKVEKRKIKTRYRRLLATEDAIKSRLRAEQDSEQDLFEDYLKVYTRLLDPKADSSKIYKKINQLSILQENTCFKIADLIIEQNRLKEERIYVEGQMRLLGVPAPEDKTELQRKRKLTFKEMFKK